MHEFGTKAVVTAKFKLPLVSGAVLLTLNCLLLAACTSIGTISPESDVEMTESSVVVIGMKQPGFYLSIWPVDFSGGMVYRKPYDGISIWGQAANGYVVGKVEPGRYYALLQIILDSGYFGNADKRPNWVACGGISTLTFEVEPGKVIYIADVEFQSAKDGEQPKFSADYYSAKIFMNKNYPELTDKMIEGTAYLMPSREHCINYF